MERTELIARLKEDLTPVKRSPSLTLRMGSWMVSIVIFGVVAILVSQTRADIHSVLTSPLFLIESAAILIAGTTSGIIALLLSTPGKQTRWYSMTGIGAITAWILSTIVAFSLQASDSTLASGLSFHGIACSQTVLVFAVAPALVLAALLRTGSAVSGKTAGALLLAAAGMFGMFILQFTCASSQSLHIMVYHLLPVLALGALGWYLGSYLCGFESRLRKKKAQILGQID